MAHVHGVADSERLKLSAEPDGFGFYYGSVWCNGEHVRIDLLPPAHLWRGDVELEGQKPDPKAWVLHLNGEEFARVERREDLQVALGIEGPTRPPGGSRLLARVRALLRQVRKP
jgi:hypothetical protein